MDLVQTSGTNKTNEINYLWFDNFDKIFDEYNEDFVILNKRTRVIFQIYYVLLSKNFILNIYFNQKIYNLTPISNIKKYLLTDLKKIQNKLINKNDETFILLLKVNDKKVLNVSGPFKGIIWVLNKNVSLFNKVNDERILKNQIINFDNQLIIRINDNRKINNQYIKIIIVGFINIIENTYLLQKLLLNKVQMTNGL